jgi:dihydrofolate reductase
MQAAVSLDGFMEGPNRDIDWHLVDDELHTHMNEELGAMSAFLSGRVVHEMMAAFWPTADQDPAAPRPMAEFAAIWREMPKFVYSRTLDEQQDWNTTVLREVDPEQIRRLKEQPGGDMVVSAGDLANELMRLGLVDEVRLYVNPVVIGAGKPMFAPGARAEFELLGTRTFGNGVVQLRYGRR